MLNQQRGYLDQISSRGKNGTRDSESVSLNPLPCLEGSTTGHGEVIAAAEGAGGVRSESAGATCRHNSLHEECEQLRSQWISLLDAEAGADHSRDGCRRTYKNLPGTASIWTRIRTPSYTERLFGVPGGTF